ncbi:helix-turn-helix domain-containing protein [Bradyrhizobium erythrophlei]|uniref:Helix-turn-helix domain-containing protein n=1 Tax=Bradyrhizobium erythrophlei TaxID=1437360 RepID=A0A1M5MNS4_9BRAD|nr:helix-turn-helix domain-containing protein [Bradyrhizobium erythrophlei]SHG79074.1 Helix-turn-helix domain-containing protein [Bradyrhizobium erythrophlei]
MHEFSQKGVVPLSERLSLSPEEASALTGIGLTTIKAATYSGALVARKNGKNTVILPEDLKAWLKSLPRIDKKSTNEQLEYA